MAHLVQREQKAKAAHPNATRRLLETPDYLLDLRLIRFVFTIGGGYNAGFRGPAF